VLKRNRIDDLLHLSAIIHKQAFQQTANAADDLDVRNQYYMRERSIQILVDYFLMVACTVVGIQIWGGLITAFEWLIPIPHPYLIVTALLGILNTGHFLWGFFYTDPDISDIPTRGLMTSYFDLQRIGIRILAFITIGPSVYLKQAIEMTRSKEENS